MSNPGAAGDERHGSEYPWRWPAVVTVVFAVAVVGGLALRVFAPSPLWLDEALSVNIAQLGFSDMVEALRRDGHPALYYLLLGWWIDLFGDGDTAVRALSGVFSLLTVPVIWLIGRRIDRATATAAAVLALVSPYVLRYGTEARMYALAVLLVALGWLAVATALESPTAGRLLGVAACTAALVHTHYWSLWVIGAALLLLVVAHLRGDPENRPAIIRVGAAVVAGGATLIVWLGVLLDQASSTGTPWAQTARPAEVIIEAIEAIGGSPRFDPTVLGIVIVVLALVGSFAVAVHGDRLELAIRPPAAVVVPAAMAALTIAVGTAAAMVTGGAFEGRYAAVIVPFVLVLAARGVRMLPAAMPTIALAGLTAMALAVGFDEARRDRTQGEEVADAIDDAASPGDVVVFCPDQLGPATVRSLAHPGPRVAYPTGNGQFVDWRDYTDQIAAIDPVTFAAAADALAGDDDVWLVVAFGYRGFEARCEAILEGLRATRDEVLVVAAGSAFESMALIRFEAGP